jgi:hypothetical protein
MCYVRSIHCRIVHGGVGVTPDTIVLASSTTSTTTASQGPLETALIRDGAFFDFATLWQQSHPNIVQTLLSNEQQGTALLNTALQGDAVWQLFEKWTRSTYLSTVTADSRLVAMAAALRSEGMLAAAAALDRTALSTELQDLSADLTLQVREYVTVHCVTTAYIHTQQS